MSELTIVETNDTHVVATWKNVVVESALAAATFRSQHVNARIIEQHVARHPGGIGHILLIPLRTPVPQADVREQMIANLRQHDAHEVLGMALVLSGSGFWAGAARGAAAGIFLAARVRYPAKIFGDIAPAADWLASCAGKTKGLTWTAGELKGAVEPIAPVSQEAR